MADWYTWDNEASAKACLDSINASTKFPIIGYNSKTHVLQPDKQKTVCWYESPLECADGKFRFPCISDKMLNDLKISKEDNDAFIATHAPVIEEYDKTWISDSEEISRG